MLQYDRSLIEREETINLRGAFLAVTVDNTCMAISNNEFSECCGLKKGLDGVTSSPSV